MENQKVSVALDIVKDILVSENAVMEMKNVFEAHQNTELVSIDPTSWAAIELLRQTKRLIDLSHQVSDLTIVVNRLDRQLSSLLSKDSQ